MFSKQFFDMYTMFRHCRVFCVSCTKFYQNWMKAVEAVVWSKSDENCRSSLFSEMLKHDDN